MDVELSYFIEFMDSFTNFKMDNLVENGKNIYYKISNTKLNLLLNVLQLYKIFLNLFDLDTCINSDINVSFFSS